MCSTCKRHNLTDIKKNSKSWKLRYRTTFVLIIVDYRPTPARHAASLGHGFYWTNSPSSDRYRNLNVPHTSEEQPRLGSRPRSPCWWWLRVLAILIFDLRLRFVYFSFTYEFIKRHSFTELLDLRIE